MSTTSPADTRNVLGAYFALDTAEVHWLSLVDGLDESRHNIRDGLEALGIDACCILVVRIA